MSSFFFFAKTYRQNVYKKMIKLFHILNTLEKKKNQEINKNKMNKKV